MVATLVGTLIVLSTLFLGTGAASAQTYPPGTSVPSCTPGDANAGNVAVGQSILFVLCGSFAPGAGIALTVNGASISVTKTPVNGAVNVHVKVVSFTILQIDDPVDATAICGTNTIAATGPTAAGGTATVKGTFTLLCPVPTSTTTTTSTTLFTGTTNTTANPGTTTTSSTTSTTVATATAPSSSNVRGLAFTGANILRALLIALALIAFGALLVRFQRRRRQAP